MEIEDVGEEISRERILEKVKHKLRSEGVENSRERGANAGQEKERGKYATRQRTL